MRVVAERKRLRMMMTSKTANVRLGGIFAAAGAQSRIAG